MPAKHILPAVVAIALTVGAIGSLHAQEASPSGTQYVYRVSVEGLSAPPPACVAGVVPNTQTASCPAGQTVGGIKDGASVFTQSYEITTACPSGEYGTPTVTPAEASPTVAATCAEPDPWAAFFKGLGIAVPNPWSAGFNLANRIFPAIPIAPYPATTVGSVTLTHSQITNIDGFSSLQSINGALKLSNNPNLTNVDGLSNLQSVYSDLALQDNPQLANVDGLSKLESTGAFYLSNTGITNVDGLLSLQSARIVLDLSNNPNLTNVNGLHNLGYIDGKLNLSNNPSLTSVGGLSHMTYVSGIFINGDPALTDLSGLSAIANMSSATVITIDAGIHLRAGFVPIQGGALCATTNAAKFKTGYATQDQVCASVH